MHRVVPVNNFHNKMESDLFCDFPISSALDVTTEKDGGVLKIILDKGDGLNVPEKGYKVTINYVGR